MNKLKAQIIPDARDKTEFPVLPKATKTQMTETNQPSPLPRHQSRIQKVTENDNLTTLLTLLTSSQLQNLIKTIINLLNKIITTHQA